MKILSIHSGHDASAAIYNNFERVAIYKEERLSRIKSDGGKIPFLSINKLKEKVDFSKIEAVLISIAQFPYSVYNFSKMKQFKYLLKDKIINNEKYYALRVKLREANTLDYNKVLNFDKLKEILGVNKKAEIFVYSHHLAHVLPILYYQKDFNNTLLYSLDGGGDASDMGVSYFNGEKLTHIFNEKEYILSENRPFSFVGQLYSAVTEYCGFKRNRHEGKITGLAAFGKPILSDIFLEKFEVKNGIILTKFKTVEEVKQFVNSFDVSKEDISASVQKFTEEIVAESIKQLHKIYGFNTIGLSGGVFSNVKLNQIISELDFIDDMFVFPPMGDEGLIVGGVFEYLIEKYGFEKFLENRLNSMEVPYWGDEYRISKKDIPNDFKIIADKDIIKNSVKLLKENKVCAIFTKSMEYGPRALGARSILINPSDRSINDTVNERLDRTEFMPFAPYVRFEKVKDIFNFPDSSLKAMKYMTVTCEVKEEFREKIQATVHVDNTARPQTIKKEDNPLYYGILEEFEKETSIPCLVNTSFNAHEEPIINTFDEALNALKNNRIDYLITDNFIIGQ